MATTLQPSTTGCWAADCMQQDLCKYPATANGQQAACTEQDGSWQLLKGDKRQRPSCDTKCTAVAPTGKFPGSSSEQSPASAYGLPCNSDCSEASAYDQHMMMCEEPAYTCAMQQDSGLESGSDLCCSTGTTSVMGVHMPEGGWFSKCRGCGWMTSHELGVCGVEMPLCKRCQQSLQSATCETLQSRMVATLVYVHHAWADAGL